MVSCAPRIIALGSKLDMLRSSSAELTRYFEVTDLKGEQRSSSRVLVLYLSKMGKLPGSESRVPHFRGPRLMLCS